MVFAQRAGHSRVRIGVRDNGPGLGSARPSEGRHGVGIENINRRLSRFYRTQLVFTIPEGGGCEVYMEIPGKEAGKKDESVPD